MIKVSVQQPVASRESVAPASNVQGIRVQNSIQSRSTQEKRMRKSSCGKWLPHHYRWISPFSRLVLYYLILKTCIFSYYLNRVGVYFWWILSSYQPSRHCSYKVEVLKVTDVFILQLLQVKDPISQSVKRLKIQAASWWCLNSNVRLRYPKNASCVGTSRSSFSLHRLIS